MKKEQEASRLRREEMKAAEEKKKKEEIEKPSSFVITKDVWEKAIEAYKHHKHCRIPNFGLVRTPIYKQSSKEE